MTTQPMSTLLQTAFVEASSSDRNDSPQPYPIRLWQIGAPPETIPSETIVIVHGRQSGDFDENLPIDQLFPRLYGLAAELSQSPSAQVFFIDAREALTDGALPPVSAARRIQAVADWTTSVFQDTQNVTMIGHSLGAYVAAEASAQLTASRLIALDAAFPAQNYDVDGLTPNRQAVRNFEKSAQTSLAFVVADGFFNLGLAGDNQQAGTAQTSLITRFDGLGGIFDADEAHGAVIDLFADLSRYLSPDTALFDSLFESLARDRYNNSGDRRGGLHEGVAYADRDDTNQWRLEWIDGDGHDLYFISDEGSDEFELDDDNAIDTVVTLKNFVLTDGAEQLILGGAAPIRGVGNDADNHLWGNRGDNTLVGKGGDDQIWADAGQDELRGNAGADMLSGHQDDDVLQGGSGNDILRGGARNDMLWGDRGHDDLYGGSGSDIFGLQNVNGVDTIQDFNPLMDTFGLSSGIRFRDLSLVQRSAGTQIRMNEDVLAVVIDTSTAELTRSHFAIV